MESDRVPFLRSSLKNGYNGCADGGGGHVICLMMSVDGGDSWRNREEPSKTPSITTRNNLKLDEGDDEEGSGL